MATITNRAIAEIESEKHYSPDNMLPFLNDRNNFLTVAVGLKRELVKLGFNGDDKQLFEAFRSLLKEKGLNSAEFRREREWWVNKSLPSRDYAIKLCFAFGLSGNAALDFLWKVCRVNGFNFRRADDVVYCYCLENGKSYSDAQDLILRYESATIGQQASENDSTKRTQILRQVFGELSGVDESAFFTALCANKKNFFEYSLTASEDIKRISGNLRNFFADDITRHNRRLQSAQMPAYDAEVSLYPEIISAFERLNNATKALKGETPVLDDLMARFPQSRYLTDMLTETATATDKEHDTARKVFVLMFFADYAFKRSKYLEKRPRNPHRFYQSFTLALNDALYKCGYALLYPANPYDWLILNCVRSLDVDGGTNEYNPVELFDNTLLALAGEEYL